MLDAGAALSLSVGRLIFRQRDRQLDAPDFYVDVFIWHKKHVTLIFEATHHVGSAERFQGWR